MKKLIITIIISLLSINSWASPQPSVNNKAAMMPTLAPMLKKVMPAVVNISVQGLTPSGKSRFPEAGPNQQKPKDNDGDQQGPRSENKRGEKPKKFASLGSGVIINPAKGYIITNAHVINNAETITVTLNDGRRMKAKLIGADPVTDIAVLQIKAKNLKTLPLADSNKAQVGDFVVAIGNPFGLNLYGTSQTASFGIISALKRSDLRIEGMENFIQTDAAINPGNSGGALVNSQGELIGINTAILAPYGGNIGIGFAIPINMAKNVMKQLIKYGSIHRGLLGIYVQHVTPELAKAFGLKNTAGALVTQINPESPAQKAGIKPGDLIIEVNGRRISGATEVKNILGLLRVGTHLNIKLLRNNKPIMVKAKIADVKKNKAAQQAKSPFLFDVFLRDFKEQSPLHGDIKGVLVTGVSQNSAMWRAGIRPGDVIIGANKTAVTDLKVLKSIASKEAPQLLLHLLRGRGALYVVVKR